MRRTVGSPPQDSTLLGRPTPWQQSSTPRPRLLEDPAKHRIALRCAALRGAARRGLRPLQGAGSAPGPPHPGVATATGPGDGAGPRPRSGLFRERPQGGAGRGGAGPGGAASRPSTPSHRGPSPPPPLRSRQRPLAASERCAERLLPHPTAPRDPAAARSPTRQRTAPLTPRSPTHAADSSTWSTAPRPHFPSGLTGKSGGQTEFPQTAPSPSAHVPPRSISCRRLGPHLRPTLMFPGPTIPLQVASRASGAGGLLRPPQPGVGQQRGRVQPPQPPRAPALLALPGSGAAGRSQAVAGGAGLRCPLRGHKVTALLELSGGLWGSPAPRFLHIPTRFHLRPPCTRSSAARPPAPGSAPVAAFPLRAHPPRSCGIDGGPRPAAVG